MTNAEKILKASKILKKNTSKSNVVLNSSNKATKTTSLTNSEKIANAAKKLKSNTNVSQNNLNISQNNSNVSNTSQKIAEASEVLNGSRTYNVEAETAKLEKMQKNKQAAYDVSKQRLDLQNKIYMQALAAGDDDATAKQKALTSPELTAFDTKLSELGYEYKANANGTPYSVFSQLEQKEKEHGIKSVESKVLQADDYKEKSAYISDRIINKVTDDERTYDYINNPDARTRVDAMHLNNGGNEFKQNGYHLLTDDEKGVYNYLYTTDKNKASEYLEKLLPDLRKRSEEETVEDFRQAAEENPGLMTAVSFGTNVADSVTAPLKAISLVGGKYDENSYILDRASKVTTAIRQEGTKDAAEKIPVNIPVIDKNLGELLYGAGTSIGDMAVATATGGKNPKVVAAIMASSAGSSTVTEAKANGASDIDALMRGTGAAAIEYATEKWSVEKLFAQPRTALSYFTQNVVSEGTEEGVSNVANIALDVVVSDITNNENKIRKDINSLIETEGISEKEAAKRVLISRLQDVGSDALVGSFTGATMSAPTTIKTAVSQQRFDKKYIDKETLSELSNKSEVKTASRNIAATVLKGAVLGDASKQDVLNNMYERGYAPSTVIKSAMSDNASLSDDVVNALDSVVDTLDVEFVNALYSDSPNVAAKTATDTYMKALMIADAVNAIKGASVVSNDLSANAITEKAAKKLLKKVSKQLPSHLSVNAEVGDTYENIAEIIENASGFIQSESENTFEASSDFQTKMLDVLNDVSSSVKDAKYKSAVANMLMQGNIEGNINTILADEATTELLGNVIGMDITPTTKRSEVVSRVHSMLASYRVGRGTEYQNRAKAKINKLNMVMKQLGQLEREKRDITPAVLSGFRNVILNGRLTQEQAKAIALDERIYELYDKITAGVLRENATINDMIAAAGYVSGFDISSDIAPYSDETDTVNVVESDNLVPGEEAGIYDASSGTIVLNKKAPLSKKLGYRLAREVISDYESKNNGSYHIYDITKDKKRRAANQSSTGLSRVEKTGAMKNNSSLNSVSENNKNVNSYSYNSLIKNADIQIKTFIPLWPAIVSGYESNRTEFSVNMVKRVRKLNNEKNTDTKTFAHCPALNEDILISRNSFKHGAARVSDTYYDVCHNITDVIENSFVINELTPREDTQGAFVLVGALQSDADIVFVRLVVEKKSWQSENYLSLKAIGTTKIKKEDVDGLKPSQDYAKGGSQTSSVISIPDLLNNVKNKQLINSVMSDNVIGQLGVQRIVDKNITYSLIDNISKNKAPGLLTDDILKYMADNLYEIDGMRKRVIKKLNPYVIEHRSRLNSALLSDANLNNEIAADFLTRVFTEPAEMEALVNGDIGLAVELAEEIKRVLDSTKDTQLKGYAVEKCNALVELIRDGSRSEGLEKFLRSRDAQKISNENIYDLMNNGRISFEDPEKEPLSKSLKDWYNATKRLVIDSGEAIKRLSDILENDTIYQLYDSAKRSGAVIKHMLENSQTDLEGRKVGKSLKQIFKPIMRNTKKYVDFNFYMQHLNNSDRDTNKDKSIFKRGSAKISLMEAKDLERRNPEFIKWKKDVDKYVDNLTRRLFDSGMMSEELYEYFKKTNPNYVPAYERTKMTHDMPTYVKNIVNKKGFRLAWGYDVDDLLPLLDALEIRTYEVVTAVSENLIALEIYNTLERRGLVEMTLEGVKVKDPALEEFVYQITKITDKTKNVLTKDGKYISSNTNDALISDIINIFDIDTSENISLQKDIRRFAKDTTFNEAFDKEAAEKLVNKFLTKRNKTDNIKTKGDGSDDGTNTELLERREISTDDRSRDSVRKQSNDTSSVQMRLGDGTAEGGILQKEQLEPYSLLGDDGVTSGILRHGSGVLRKLSGIKLSSVDIKDRALSEEIIERNKDTIFKTSDGKLAPVFHWTDAIFDEFKKGEFAFHAGTVVAADARRQQCQNKNPEQKHSIYKELYVSMKNPVVLQSDTMKWDSLVISNLCLKQGIISKEEISHVEKLEGYILGDYNSEAATEMRRILSEKGYDGILYKNDIEGDMSVMIFDPDQIITVAENGVDIINTATYGKETKSEAEEILDKIRSASLKAIEDAKSERADMEKNPDVYRYVTFDMHKRNNMEFGKNEQDGNRLLFYRDGIRYSMDIGKGLFEGLKNINFEPEAKKALIPFQKATSIFKKLVTSWNIFFGPRNAIRDLQDAILFSQDTFGMLANFPAAYKEIISNGEMWQEYQALGGTGGSYYDFKDKINLELEPGVKSTVKRKAKAIAEAYEHFNLVIEQAPRLAEYMMLVKKSDGSYKSKIRAVYGAQEVTVNFNRSGIGGRFLNNTIVPFFNPAVQGMNRYVRLFTEVRGIKPLLFLAGKLLVLGFAAGGINDLIHAIYEAATGEEDETYDQLTDYQKQNNFLFPIGDGRYVKIPKGRSVNVLGIQIQNVIDTIQGEDVDWLGGILTSVDQISPNNPLTDNIFMPVILAGFNKTWYGGSIESAADGEVDARYHFDETTDYFSRWVGDMLNISPKKINYVLDSYSGVIGDYVLPLLTPKEGNNWGASLALTALDNVIVDGTTSSRISSDYYSLVDKVTHEKNDPTATETTSAIIAGKYLNSQTKAIQDLYCEMQRINTGNLSAIEKAKKSRETKAVINGIMLNAIATEQEVYDAAENIKSKYAYKRGNSYYDNEGYELSEDKYYDIIYCEVNREVFGAEYALQTYDTKVYAKAAEAVKDGASFDLYYDAYFDTRSIEGDIDFTEGTIVSGSARKNKWNCIKDMDASRKEKAALASSILDIDSKKLREADTYGVDTYDYIDFLCTTSSFSSDKERSKKEKVLRYINSMSVSRKEKDALYILAGYSKKTISDAPWR